MSVRTEGCVVDINSKRGNERQDKSAKFLRIYSHTCFHNSALSVAHTSQACTSFVVVGTNKTRLG